MSYWKRNDDSYTWKVRLYNEPEKLFVGTTNYADTPQINQQICAYRYGTFEYGALIKDDGTPTITDELCEIIGITKKPAEICGFFCLVFISAYLVLSRRCRFPLCWVPFSAFRARFPLYREYPLMEE